MEASDKKMDITNPLNDYPVVQDTIIGGKESEGENVDAIKKFIENQEKEINDRKKEELNASLDSSLDPNEGNSGVDCIISEQDSIKRKEIESVENIESAMEILTQSEAVKRDMKPLNKTFSTNDKGTNSMALSVGSKVEAKDFGDDWYVAQIVEVDYDEMEVLVHYENNPKRHDEWISVSSPRLRPVGSQAVKRPQPVKDVIEPVAVTKEDAKDIRQDDKPKHIFVEGERCLARWRDNRRFMATVNNVLGNGNYEVIFDDGFHWTCNVSRLYKMKAPDALTVDTSMKSSLASTLSPVQHGGPSSSSPLPAYHTHLFDPARDYLGSKSERRELKRKLNIKEIFNIGQKRSRVPKDGSPVEKKPRIIRRQIKPKQTVVKSEVITEVKSEVPDAVASIIGTVKSQNNDKLVNKVKEEDIELTSDIKPKEDIKNELMHDEQGQENEDETFDALEDMITDEDPVSKEEEKLEKFEKQDNVKHEEVIDKIKEAISKLEGGLNKEEKVNSHKPEVKDPPLELKVEPTIKEEAEKPKKNVTKIKKGKKLRLLQEKKVKKQVEKVKSELEEMKKQVEEMRQQMLAKTQDLESRPQEMPESFLLPGEWCCKWVNGQPLGTVSEMECEVKTDANNRVALPRRSVQVEDKRLPEGWTKHMVRRSLGHSAGKWDVVLVSPGNKKFHNKGEIRNYLENNPEEAVALMAYEHALTDFGVHLKLSRRMGWMSTTPGGVPESPTATLPFGAMSVMSPLHKRKKLSLKKTLRAKEKERKMSLKIKLPKIKYHMGDAQINPSPEVVSDSIVPAVPYEQQLEDGFVYVGSMKVQVIDNLLRCPAENCLKNFRNNTLLKMHIKHYHRELRKLLGQTPKVLDLAYARTLPTGVEKKRTKHGPRVIKVKLPKSKREEPKTEVTDLSRELRIDTSMIPTGNSDTEGLPLDSPQLRNALIHKPVRRPKVLLPVRRPEPEPIQNLMEEQEDDHSDFIEPEMEPVLEPLDFEQAISTHTVTRPMHFEKRKTFNQKKRVFALSSQQPTSEDEDWFTMNSDVDTRSSLPGSDTPDSKNMDGRIPPMSSESNEDQKDSNMYMFTENGERIKLVHMKREEIINCHCGFREEDGLMVQCELCLCWQHAACHNIHTEADVPEKYTCSICLNPRRGRRSQRFLHDQSRMYEGTLPGGVPSDTLRRSHELAGNLLRVADALHALRVKCSVAAKKDHPKLYLWAQDWEHAELSYTQEKLNSDYSDLNIMINTLGKENLPIKTDDVKDLGMHTPPLEENDTDSPRYSHREPALGSQVLLSGLLASPGGASLDLPISTSELERLAKSVQEQEWSRSWAPVPEAAIESGACRRRLVAHVARTHAQLDARLDSIEAQVAELESQDPSFEDDETAEYFPRTKQTIQMLLRDLETMEELGVIT